MEDFDDNSNRMAILVVDSEPDRLQHTSNILTNAGYPVIPALTADNARSLYDENLTIGLVVARVVLSRGLSPGLSDGNGVQLANHVRDSERGVNTLLISHYSRDLLRYIPGFLDHDNFLPNPYPDELLLSRVRRLVNRQK